MSELLHRSWDATPGVDLGTNAAVAEITDEGAALDAPR